MLRLLVCSMAVVFVSASGESFVMASLNHNVTLQDLCNEYPDPASCKSNPSCMFSKTESMCKTCPFNGNSCLDSGDDCCDHLVCEGVTASANTKVCKACDRVATQDSCESFICNANADVVTYFWTGSACKACESVGQDDCSKHCGGSFWDGKTCKTCGSCPNGHYRSGCSGPSAGECKPDVRIGFGESTKRKKCVTASVGVICDADAGDKGKKANSDFPDADDAFVISVSGARSERVCAQRVGGSGWGQDLAIWCRPLHPLASNQLV